MNGPHYKWLLPGRETSYQSFTWPVEVGEWTVKETPALCQSGWHFTDEAHVLDHLPQAIGAELWEVEVRGAVVHGSDKSAAESMRLKWLVGTMTEQNLRLFAADCAEDVLPIFWKVSPNDHRPADSIAVARRRANGEGTPQEWDAAWAAAWAAAWDAVWAAARAAARAAVGAAARAAARDAAGDAAWAAARAAVGAAARDAAGAAARDAAWAAAGDAAGTAAWAAAWAAAGAAAWDAAGAAAGAAAWAAAGAAAWDAARAAAWDAARAKYSNWLIVRIESGY